MLSLCDAVPLDSVVKNQHTPPVFGATPLDTTRLYKIPGLADGFPGLMYPRRKTRIMPMSRVCELTGKRVMTGNNVQALDARAAFGRAQRWAG